MNRFFNPASIALAVILTALLGIAVNWDTFPTAAEEARYTTARTEHMTLGSFEQERNEALRAGRAVAQERATPWQLPGPR